MPIVTTARLVANQALQLACGQECVDWAIGMLEDRCDGPFLRMLASRCPPYNHFEIADNRDRAFEELGLRYPGDSAAINLYGAERIRIALDGGEDLAVTLHVLRDTCIARGYKELYEFYMLSFAYERLQAGEGQLYWPDATLENIFAIVRNEAEKLATKVERTA
jgi:hypothetical protein